MDGDKKYYRQSLFQSASVFSHHKSIDSDTERYHSFRYIPSLLSNHHQASIQNSSDSGIVEIIMGISIIFSSRNTRK